MSKVRSMAGGGALDLDARDPNNLNEHLQVTLISQTRILIFTISSLLVKLNIESTSCIVKILITYLISTDMGTQQNYLTTLTMTMMMMISSWFLAVQNSSLGDLVTDSLTHSLTRLLLLRYKERS